MEFGNYYGHCAIQPNVEQLVYLQTGTNSTNTTNTLSNNSLQSIHHQIPHQSLQHQIQHQSNHPPIQLNQLDLDRHLSSPTTTTTTANSTIIVARPAFELRVSVAEDPQFPVSSAATCGNPIESNAKTKKSRILKSKPNQSQKNKTTKISPKKRPCNPENWIRNANSRKRIKGLEYQTRNGKTIPAKVFRDKLCNCSMKCNEKIGAEQREKVMKDFYKISQNVMQNLFIRGLVKANPVKQRRPVNQSRKEKSKSFVYYIRSGGIDIRVCKRYFADTFQISDVRIYKCTKSDDIDSVFEHRGHKIPWNKNKKQPPRKPKQKRPLPDTPVPIVLSQQETMNSLNESQLNETNLINNHSNETKS